MGSFGIGHWIIVLLIAMILFGAGRISDIGKGLGEGIRNFKKGLREDEDDPKAKPKPAELEEEVEVQVVKVPKQLPASEPAPKKKKIIQVEVEDDADEAEIARKVAAKKKAMAEDEKAS